MLGLSTNRNAEISETSFVAGRTDNAAPVILVAEDNEDSRLMIKLLLEIWKYGVVAAENGEEAVRLAAETRPDLILMDVRMPRIDGFDATRQIRATEANRRVPIIFLSGCAETIYKNAARAVGGNEYFVKPLDFKALENTLRKYTRQFV